MYLLLLGCAALGLGTRWLLPRPWMPSYRDPFDLTNAAAFLALVPLCVWVIWLRESARRLKNDLKNNGGQVT